MDKFFDRKRFLKGMLKGNILKKIAAVLVIVALFLGGGAICHNQQKEARMQAQNTVILKLAKEKNISLLDDEKVRAIVAKFIGADENSITYKKIALSNGRSENFEPVYKISCSANDVKYKIFVNAVSGDILNCKVG